MCNRVVQVITIDCNLAMNDQFCLWNIWRVLNPSVCRAPRKIGCDNGPSFSAGPLRQFLHDDYPQTILIHGRVRYVGLLNFSQQEFAWDMRRAIYCMVQSSRVTGCRWKTSQGTVVLSEKISCWRFASGLCNLLKGSQFAIGNTFSCKPWCLGWKIDVFHRSTL